MPSAAAVQQIMQTPEVLGLVHCSGAGEVVLCEGREVESLTSVLGHFLRVATMLAGREDLHQAQIKDKPLTALCMQYEGGAIGVVIDSRARVADVALLLRRAIGDGRG